MPTGAQHTHLEALPGSSGAPVRFFPFGYVFYGALVSPEQEVSMS